MPPADPPTPFYILLVVGAREKFLQPAQQRALEAGHLLTAASNDSAGVWVAVDLLIKVINERWQARGEHCRYGLDALANLRCPANVPLQFLIPAQAVWRVGARPRIERAARQKCPPTGSTDRVGRHKPGAKKPAMGLSREYCTALAGKECVSAATGPALLAVPAWR